MRRLVCILLPMALVSDARAQDSVESIVRQHAASLAAIRSVTCSIQIDRKGRQFEGEYANAQGNVRINCRRSDGVVMEHCVENGMQSAVTHTLPGSKGVESGGMIAHYKGAELGECDYSVKGLLRIELPNELVYLPLEQLISQASAVNGPIQETVDGRQLTVIELILDRPAKMPHKWTQKVYLDPTVNWMVRQVSVAAQLSSGRHVQRVYKVTEFSEPAPGLFLPTKIEASLIENHSQRSPIFQINVSQIRVNSLIPAETFTMKYPQGLKVLNSIDNTIYRVDPAGKPLANPEPYKRLQGLGVPNDGQADNSPKIVKSATASLSVQWSTVLMWVSLTVLVCTIALYLYRVRFSK